MEFFRALGRTYGVVGTLALLIALATGAILLDQHPWDGLMVAAVVVAGVLLVATAAGMAQARAMTRLRRRAVAQLGGEPLDPRVRRGAIVAAILRACIGILTLALVVLGAAWWISRTMDRLPSSDRARVEEEPVLAAWKLPLIVAAIAVVIVGGFYLGGPGLGMAAGALAATSIVVMAVRHPPQTPIVPAPLRDFRHHLLVVVSGALEDERAIEQIVEVAGIGDIDQAEAEVSS